jgi:peptide-methionine (S)-S-oxide reductase
MPLSPRLTTAAALSTLAVSLLALPLIAAGLLPRLGATSAVAASLPDPDTGITLAAGPRATAVLAGGCFWGMEAVFEHVHGVTEVVTGYTGGSPATAAYDSVSGGGTGHAEGIRITYDPARVRMWAPSTAPRSSPLTRSSAG